MFDPGAAGEAGSDGQLLLPGFAPCASGGKRAPAERPIQVAGAGVQRDLYPTFAAVHRELKPRTPVPPIEIRFHPFAHLNHTLRLREGRLLVRISDLLEAAPEPILEALAQILLRKLYRKPASEHYRERYRRYIHRREITAGVEAIRRQRGSKRLSSERGSHYDLAEIFAELNAIYFHGLMAQPRLGWGPVRARHNLAHYDAAHNVILVSTVFDHPGMPRWVLAYVLYHEMLHLKFPVRTRGSRRLIHPPEFQVEERKFPRWREAEAFLKTL